MEALEIMLNTNSVVPFYQAIFSADSHDVIGYEVLARIKTKDGIKSLGAFFHDPKVPDDFKIDIDKQIQTEAYNHILQTKSDSLFFINVNANHLMIDQGHDFLETLHFFADQGLPLNQIVIEITEHDYQHDLSKLSYLLKYFKTLGVKIALDDVGTGASNLDRIGILEPDILKVDIHSINNQELTVSYHGVIYSLGLLARKIGADILFEAIETKHQLHYSWRKNGRYFQGFFLSKPLNNLIEKDLLKENFKEDVHHFISMEKGKINTQYSLASQLNDRLKHLLKKVAIKHNLDQWMIQVAHELDEVCFRIYITDEDGFQQTANGLKQGAEWFLEEEIRGKNWSWRPFFIENIIRMNNENKGILSDIYSDIETGELMRTYSHPINEKLFLFIDIPHSYLYEHEDFLW